MAYSGICIIDGCDKHVHKNPRYCSMHAERIRKYGDPHKGAFMPRGSCSIEGCESAHYGRGLCVAHYKRLKKYGDPLGGSTPRGAARKWVKSTALTHTGDECLIYPYYRNASGYGMMKNGADNIGVHVYVLTATDGDKPTPEHECCHSCGNGHLGCVNRKHLYWGTRAENVRDSIEAGTFWPKNRRR